MRKLLVRLGCSFHKVSGFLFKADQEKQKEFVAQYEQDKQKVRSDDSRRYFIDGVHPLYGLEVVFYCWLLAGQRFEVGVGGGRKGLNILGAYCPDDMEYLWQVCRPCRLRGLPCVCGCGRPLPPTRIPHLEEGQ